MRKTKSRSRLSGFIRRLLLGALLFVITASLLVTLPFRWIPPPTSAFILQAQSSGLGSQRPCTRIAREWVAWSDIASTVPLAVIASEDQLFLSHWGFDFNAIAGVIRGLGEGGRIRGASTITQQLIKNLYLWPGQSWPRKAVEGWMTLVLESTWPKRRILEVYLNMVQFSDCTFGVAAASRRFFGKPASRLSARESALLASVLPNPVRYTLSRPTDYMQHRTVWILQQMQALGGVGTITSL